MITRYQHLQTTLLVRASKNENTYPERFHDKVEMVLVEEGTLEIVIEGVSYTLQKGDIYVLFPNVLHSIAGQNCRKYMILVSSALVSDFGLLQYKPDYPVVRAQQLNPVVPALIRRCEQLYRGEENRSLLLLHINSILGELLPLLSLRSRSTQPELVQQVVETVLSSSSENISLEKLARQLGYSKYHISHTISENFGCNFRTLVNSYRISEAEQQLLHSQKPVSQIMYECGFQNQCSFNRAFLKYTGMSPSAYRKLHRCSEK